MLLLSRFFSEQGRTVELLLFRPKGAYSNSIPSSVSTIALKPSSALRGRLLALKADVSALPNLLNPVLLPVKADSNLRHIEALTDYLSNTPPDILLSAMTYTNLVALWARQLSGNNTPVVVSERIALTTHIQNQAVKNDWRWKYLLPAVNHAYQKASGIVTVSNSVAKDLLDHTGLSARSITTIYNPVVDNQVEELARQPLQHPWFSKKAPPVILSAGRLTPQKDFPTLLRAFAKLKEDRPAKLIILGEGRLRRPLQQLSKQLGIDNDLELPGFVQNPYQYMARANAFVLPSLYEGLPGVLIQALACGCPVISTDCPGGSAEILDYGKYGALTPIGDAETMAGALRTLLDSHIDRETLVRRAQLFSVETAGAAYLSELDTVFQAEQRDGR